jgi:uncharacterized protein
MELELADNPDRKRYEARSGSDVVASTYYRLGDGAVEFTHTETVPEAEGKGIASRLVRYALDDVRGRGLAVLPYCPYVRGWIGRHPEYVDLVPAERRDDFELAPA